MVSEENLRALSRGSSSYIVAKPYKRGFEVVMEVLFRHRVLAELEAKLAVLARGPGGHLKHTCQLLASWRYRSHLRKLKSGVLRINRRTV